jgi:hypothetical protein
VTFDTEFRAGILAVLAANEEILARVEEAERPAAGVADDSTEAK